ncbi:MAG TPA: hypothetical protein VFZ61_30960 [Polyangiales bacterium]
MRRLLPGCLLLASAGCGVQEIELAPDLGQVIVQGDVPRAALEQLARAPAGKPEPRVAVSEPADGSAIPGNIAPLGFRFKSDKKPMMMEPMMMEPMMMKPAGGGVQAFELTLRAGARELRLYTRDERAVLPAAHWQSLLDVPAGTQLEAQLQALQEDGRIVTSAPITITLLAPLARGGLAYWSDSGERALGVQLEQEAAYDLQVAFPSLQPWESWHAQTKLFASAQDGLLRVMRAEQELAPAWAVAWQIEQPEWLADASALLFVTFTPGGPPVGMRPPMTPPEAAPAPGVRSRVMRARWLDALTLAEPELLTESDKADESLRAPSACPGARWVVFERAKEKDATGRLWVVPAEGGEATELALEPGWKGEGGTPTCLPGGAEGELWVAFSQARGPGDDKLEPSQLQLWLVAAREDSEGRLVATHQPFWLPQQRPNESNRRLLWFDE